MKDYIGKNVLITTASWFTGKDGKEYRAVYGELKAIHECGKTLGFIPNRSHANWFIEIGNMIIMGCQVMYFEQADGIENGRVMDHSIDSGKLSEYERPTRIYIA